MDDWAGGTGSVFGGWGRWSRRKRVEVGVRKAEMWEEAKWLMRLRYLCHCVCY